MRLLIILFLLISYSGFAQYKSFTVGVKGDTLNRVDIKGRKQGPWVEKVDNVRGERGYEEQGFYLNGSREGQWQRFSLDGDLVAIENYRWGFKNGKSVYMTPMGDPLREENWRAVNPAYPYDTIDVYDPNNMNRVVERRIIKLEGTALKHGTWRYYDPLSGKLEKREEYIFDKLKTPGEDLDLTANKSAATAEDDLAPIDVTGAGRKKPAYQPKTEEEKKKLPKPQAIIDFEKKNAGKRKVKVRDGSTF